MVDRDDVHPYQPGYLFLPFGTYSADQITRPRHTLLPDGVNFVIGDVDRIDAPAKTVALSGGRTLACNYLVIASGTTPRPDQTPGMLGDEWRRSIFDFYTFEGSKALAKALTKFDQGRLVVHITDMPIKCPVAPLEFTFLAESWLRERGLRDRVEITYVTPLPGAFTKPIALQSRALPSIFAAGDASDIPASKAGSVAHFSVEIFADNFLQLIAGKAMTGSFDGHANCFIESGDGKGLLIDFNYDTEPLPGKFPLPVLGPMALLKETKTNHLGKLAFRRVRRALLRPSPGRSASNRVRADRQDRLRRRKPASQAVAHHPARHLMRECLAPGRALIPRRVLYDRHHSTDERTPHEHPGADRSDL